MKQWLPTTDFTLALWNSNIATTTSPDAWATQQHCPLDCHPDCHPLMCSYDGFHSPTLEVQHCKNYITWCLSYATALPSGLPSSDVFLRRISLSHFGSPTLQELHHLMLELRNSTALWAAILWCVKQMLCSYARSQIYKVSTTAALSPSISLPFLQTLITRYWQVHSNSSTASITTSSIFNSLTIKMRITKNTLLTTFILSSVTGVISIAVPNHGQRLSVSKRQADFTPESDVDGQATGKLRGCKLPQKFS